MRRRRRTRFTATWVPAPCASSEKQRSSRTRARRGGPKILPTSSNSRRSRHPIRRLRSVPKSVKPVGSTCSTKRPRKATGPSRVRALQELRSRQRAVDDPLRGTLGHADLALATLADDLFPEVPKYVENEFRSSLPT